MKTLLDMIEHFDPWTSSATPVLDTDSVTNALCNQDTSLITFSPLLRLSGFIEATLYVRVYTSECLNVANSLSLQTLHSATVGV